MAHICYRDNVDVYEDFLHTAIEPDVVVTIMRQLYIYCEDCTMAFYSLFNEKL